LRIEGVDTFVANLSDRAYFADPVKPGDKVTATWETKDVHVLSKADSEGSRSPYGD
jgi:putative spermidine/putrescine transport system ATP-binding protein